MLAIVDTDQGFFVVDGSCAWPAGWDAYNLGTTVQAIQSAEEDGEIPFGGAIVPRRADDVMRLRGAKVLAS